MTNSAKTQWQYLEQRPYCKDFEILHQERIDNPGILGIYQDRKLFQRHEY